MSDYRTPYSIWARYEEHGVGWKFDSLPIKGSDGMGYSVLAVDPGTVTGAVKAAWPDREAMVRSVRKLGPVKAIRACAQAGAEGVGGIELKEVDSADPFVARGRFGEDGVVRELLPWIWTSSVVIIEDFILRRPEKSRSLLSPVRIGAKIEYECIVRKNEVVWQSSADKSVWEDQVRAGLGGRGVMASPHIRDALSHLALYLAKCV